ncbi:thioredoxin-disulfide reductase [Syntrophaceticus schinkii]|uniref:Thioredoxin reductase n=1 Tax=Syntrophaceticus schinkii TaxID=499207 RepID=A0A0B7MS95_9FIRM|nr:thioredoxin-disulfide reductase [Syntrophaceticus schinkii]CEO90557.1 Thioredoxin reductase (modular protein) [Syntrophaceticus schinkii]
MSEAYDIIVVGGGPAGLAAGIYGSRSRLKTVILQKGRPGGQAATTEELENYPGFPRGTTGPGLMEAMAKHAESFGTEILNEEAVDLDLDGEIKVVKTKSGKKYSSKIVILAPGAAPRTLNIKGERELRGKGVSYCATCDADFFEELDVVVVGNGDAAIEEAMYITKFAETVTIIVIHDEGILDCNKVSAEKAFANPKIKWVWNSVLQEIKGDGIVESVVLKNIKTGELSEMETNGVFFFVGTVPKTDIVKGKVELNEQGYIIANERMETSVPGVYAAGDARDKYLRQVITAASDGAIAAFAAEKYLAEEEGFKSQVLNTAKPVMVAFWAPQVEASIAAVSQLEKIVDKLGDSVKLVKMDTYRNERVAKRYGIEEIPSVLFFYKGEVAAKISGGFSEEAVISQLNSLNNK